ncbi:MAG: hypothetical protein WAW99_03835 [Candidatus Bipolaricaulis anaerobius]|jgi:hypothetical protein
MRIDLNLGRCSETRSQRVFSKQQLTALQVLGEGGSTKEAAEQAGCTTRAVRKWLHVPEFSDALAELQKELVAGTLRQLRVEGPRAVKTLARIMGDEDGPSTPRVSAAKAILDGLFKGDELERITALEAAVRELQEAR